MKTTFIIVLVWGLVGSSSSLAQESVSDELRFRQGDEKENEIRAAKTEYLVSQSEKRAIAQLKKILKKKRGTKMEPELLFRLAELYVRRSKTARFFDLYKDSENVRRVAPKLVKKSSARRYLRQAIQTYARIQKRFPKFYNMDLVLFNRAFASQQIGKVKAAEWAYRRVINKHPKSPLVPDCHLAIGELAYDQQRYTVALKHYLTIKKYPNSKVYPYGLYKSAWSYYNLQRNAKALVALEEVVAFGRHVEKNNLDARLDLRSEALSDMTLFYGEVHPSKRAFSYFTEQAGEKKVGPLLLQLADLYDRHGRLNDQRQVLRDYISGLPYSENRPEAHDAIVWSFEEDRERGQAVGELTTFLGVCDPSGSWVKKHRERLVASQPQKSQSEAWQKEMAEKAYADCQDILDETSLKLASKWQGLWQKNKKAAEAPPFEVYASKAYEIYLARASDHPKYNEARFRYASLLFNLKRYREASEQYSIVARTEEKNKEMRHDSGYSSLVSLEKAVKDKWNDEDERLFQKLATVYITRNPKGQYVVDVEFKMAFIAYEKGRFDEAEPRLKKLGWMYPKAERGIKAQDLYLDILNAKKDFATLMKATQELMKLTGVKNQKRLDSLKNIYEQSYFAKVQKLEADGQYKEAIAGYESFIRENPSSKLSQASLWNSTQLRYKVGDELGGADSAFRYYQSYPKTKNAKEALYQAAQSYESLGRLEKATLVLDELMQVDKKDRVKWTLLSGDFYFLTGRYKKAEKRYESLISAKSRQTRVEALQKLELMYSDIGNRAQQDRVRRKIAATGVEPYASQALFDQLKEAYDSKNYSVAFQKAMSLLGRRQASNYVKANARLIQAEILAREFKKQSTKARPERIAMVLAIKTEKLDKAQRAYEAVLRFQEPESAVAALEGLSSCSAHYAEAIRGFKLPASVPKAEAQAFRSEMENLAFPMEERSVEMLAQALKKAREFELRNGTVARLQKELDRINMRKRQIVEIAVDNPEINVPRFGGLGS